MQERTIDSGVLSHFIQIVFQNRNLLQNIIRISADLLTIVGIDIIDTGLFDEFHSILNLSNLMVIQKTAARFLEGLVQIVTCFSGVIPLIHVAQSGIRHQVAGILELGNIDVGGDQSGHDRSNALNLTQILSQAGPAGYCIKKLCSVILNTLRIGNCCSDRQHFRMLVVEFLFAVHDLLYIINALLNCLLLKNGIKHSGSLTVNANTVSLNLDVSFCHVANQLTRAFMSLIEFLGVANTKIFEAHTESGFGDLLSLTGSHLLESSLYLLLTICRISGFLYCFLRGPFGAHFNEILKTHLLNGLQCSIQSGIVIAEIHCQRSSVCEFTVCQDALLSKFSRFLKCTLSTCLCFLFFCHLRAAALLSDDNFFFGGAKRCVFLRHVIYLLDLDITIFGLEISLFSYTYIIYQ